MQKVARINAIMAAGLCGIWLIAVPCIFALLYSVIEMQSSARVAVGANTKLAAYTINRIADRIIFLEKNLVTNKLKLALAVSENDKASASVIMAQQQSAAMIASAAKLLWGNQKEPYQCDGGLRCLEAVMIESRQHDWAPDAAIPKQVEAARSAMADAQKIIFNQAAQKAPIDQLKDTIQRDESELTGTVGPGVRREDGVNADSSEDAHSVALSYNQQRRFLLFEPMFFLPPGVVIAFFTGLMGAIGAAIFSLFTQLYPAQYHGDGVPPPFLLSYGVRPLLGALSGFTVFFVVSAGASFLIQPGAASATQAVNQLSPPALASLGIFSGLASDRALGWLIDKAQSFFKVGDSAAPLDNDLPKQC